MSTESAQRLFEEELTKLVDRSAEEELHTFQRLFTGLDRAFVRQQDRLPDRLTQSQIDESRSYLHDTFILRAVRLVEQYAEIFSVLHPENKYEHLITSITNYFIQRQELHKGKS